MHAFHVEMRHLGATAVGIRSPELRQAQKALEKAWGLHSCAAPANMALSGLQQGGPYTAYQSPRGGKLGCGFSWILESTQVLTIFLHGLRYELAPKYNRVPNAHICSLCIACRED